MPSNPADKRIFSVALAFCPLAKSMVSELIESDISPEEFFTLPPLELRNRLNIAPSVVIDQYGRGEIMERASKEIEFMDRHHIRTVSYYDEEYPDSLAASDNPPAVLFILGHASISQAKPISIVGTRRCTAYGVNFCKSVVKNLSELSSGICVISGLAYGIDASAHTAALENNLTTIAVLAHGLDMIYPAQHRDLAKRILDANGALVSEYPTGTKPFRNNFLARNRIVACIPDGVLVVESEVKGGAMSTANYAFCNNREVMALPGRANDPTSSGCNLLIRHNKAVITTSAADIVDTLHWDINTLGTLPGNMQQSLFPELEGDALAIYTLLKQYSQPMQLDAIHSATGIPVAKLLSTLGDLEFDGIVVRLPGNRYDIV